MTDSSKSPFCGVWFTALFGVCFYLQQSSCPLIVVGFFSELHDFVCGILISLVFYFIFLAWRWCLTASYLMQLFSSFFLRIAVHAAVFHQRSPVYWVINLTLYDWGIAASIHWFMTTLSHVSPKLALQLQIQVFSLEFSTNIRNLGEQKLSKEVTY